MASWMNKTGYIDPYVSYMDQKCNQDYAVYNALHTRLQIFCLVPSLMLEEAAECLLMTFVQEHVPI